MKEREKEVGREGEEAGTLKGIMSKDLMHEAILILVQTIAYTVKQLFVFKSGAQNETTVLLSD